MAQGHASLSVAGGQRWSETALRLHRKEEEEAQQGAQGRPVRVSPRRELGAKSEELDCAGCSWPISRGSTAL